MMEQTWKLSDNVDGLSTGIREFLKLTGYPAPEDCPKEGCKEYRPACLVGVCKIAVCLCGDW